MRRGQGLGFQGFRVKVLGLRVQRAWASGFEGLCGVGWSGAVTVLHPPCTAPPGAAVLLQLLA